MTPVGLGPEKDCADEAHQLQLTTDPGLRRYNYGVLTLQIGRISNVIQENVDMSTVGFGPENDCADEVHQL
jgi:hypothetical protein